MSSSKDSLIPIRRPDKNGRIVTRWVRSWEADSITANLPHPVILSPRGRDLEEIRAELSEALGGRVYEDAVGNVTDNLDNLGGETLQLLLDSYKAEGKADELGLWVSTYGNRSNGDFGEAMIRELTTYMPAFSSQTDPHFIDHAVSALGEYKQLPHMDDYSKADPELKQFIHDLMSLTDHLYSDWFDEDEDSVPHIIEDEELVSLIFEYPDKVMLVKSAIVERGGTPNTSVIRNVLENDSTALSQGAL